MHACEQVLPLGRYCESLQRDLDETNRVKTRALRTLAQASKPEGEGETSYSAAESVMSTEEIIQLAVDAQATVAAVVLEQEQEAERAGESDGVSPDEAATEEERFEGRVVGSSGVVDSCAPNWPGAEHGDAE